MRLVELRVRIVAILAVAAIGLVMIYYEIEAARIGIGALLPEGKLTGAQDKAIDIQLDLSKILIAWTVGVIGATGFFLRITLEKDMELYKTDLVLSFTVIALSIFSLYFGHLLLAKTSEILALQQFPVTNPIVHQAGRLQYLCGLAAIGLFVVHMLNFYLRQINAQSQAQDKGGQP